MTLARGFMLVTERLIAAGLKVTSYLSISPRYLLLIKQDFKMLQSAWLSLCLSACLPACLSWLCSASAQPGGKTVLSLSLIRGCLSCCPVVSVDVLSRRHSFREAYPAVLLSHCPAVQLSCCPAVPLFRCPAVLLSSCPAVLLSSSVCRCVIL